jgi:hypothetical protein
VPDARVRDPDEDVKPGLKPQMGECRG